jgi:hypothetical protein
MRVPISVIRALVDEFESYKSQRLINTGGDDLSYNLGKNEAFGVVILRLRETFPALKVSK